MGNIIRNFSEIENEIKEKEYFLRHECGICDALVNNRELGMAVAGRLIKIYQLEKRDRKGIDSEFSKRRKKLLSEIEGLYETHGINEYDPWMSNDIRNYRQAKRYYAELPGLDAELEIAMWISEHGDNFAEQLEAYRNGGFECDIEKLMECAETYLDALERKIRADERAIDKEKENDLHKTYIAAATREYRCESTLSAVNDCIEKAGETENLVKERSERKILLYQAREDMHQCYTDEIDVTIENLEKRREISRMKIEYDRIVVEMEKATVSKTAAHDSLGSALHGQ